MQTASIRARRLLRDELYVEYAKLREVHLKLYKCNINLTISQRHNKASNGALTELVHLNPARYKELRSVAIEDGYSTTSPYK